MMIDSGDAGNYCDVAKSGYLTLLVNPPLTSEMADFAITPLGGRIHRQRG